MTQEHEHDHHQDAHQSVSASFLEHMKNPKHVGKISKPSGKAQMLGSCGDSIGMEISVVDEKLAEVRVQPRGCAYTLVCADVVADLAQGRTLDQAMTIEPEDVIYELGSLPEDHYHCARLAVNTLGEALSNHLEQRTQKKGCLRRFHAYLRSRLPGLRL